MNKFFSLVFLGAGLLGCAPGSCYQAMKFRKAAETAQGIEKAALLGKADAVQKECDAQNAALQETQKRQVRGKARR